MFLRDVDRSAYERVLYFEVLLRRVIRWEARGARGRQWLGAFGGLQDKIEERIVAEKRSESFNSDSSELSYLFLSELLDIVFSHLWSECFQRVLANKKGIRTSPCRGLNAVRNKVAHFRPVNATDGALLEKANYLFQVLDAHYRHHLKASAYVPGAFDKADDQLNIQEIDRLTASLEANKAISVWEEFQRLESIRAYGMSPGIGLVSHHIFYEIYTKGAFSAPRLTECLEKNKYDITFMNVGLTGSYVRIFLPIKLAPSDIQRVMKKITTAARDSVMDEPRTSKDVIRDFDVGYLEQLGADQANLYFGFVF